MEQSDLSECVRYFKERPVFRRLFLKMKKKYESLGHWGGSVTLTGLSAEEKMQLGGFFRKDFLGKQAVAISYQAMEKALLDSRFHELCWQDILSRYFGQSLVTKKEDKEQKEKEQESFLGELDQRYQAFYADEKCRQWVHSLFQEGQIRQYQEHKDQLSYDIGKTLLAGTMFPARKGYLETLPVFSAKVTGDPHYFDEGTSGEKLLYSYLEYFLGKENADGLSRAEQKGKLYYRAGIMKDDLSNVVLAYRIHGRNLKTGGLHQGLEGFAKEKEPVQITLMTLGNLKEAWADSRQVYMLENPSVFSYLCKKYPEVSFVCGNGQIRLAVWELLDFLCKNHTVYYAGDFDPEGLLIAQKLKKRYRDRVVLWGYEERYCDRYISKVEISEARLKKLEKLTLLELQGIKERLLKEKRALYQEAIMEEYRIGTEGLP